MSRMSDPIGTEQSMPEDEPQAGAPQGATEQTAQNLSEQGQQIGDKARQVGESTRQVGQQVRELGATARQAASETYDQVRGQAQDYYEQGKQKLGEYQGELETYVREQPIKALLIAAGIGLLVGVIWKRS